jgi:hypothetical protein
MQAGWEVSNFGAQITEVELYGVHHAEQQMTLTDAVRQLDALDDGKVMCVRQPWSADAECMLVELGEDMRVPAQVEQAGLKYFLEVHVAKEVLGVFGDNPTALEDRVRLLLYYGENDAYPEWVYE